MISSTAGSSSSACSGPRPSARSVTRRVRSARAAASSSGASRSTSAAIRASAGSPPRRRVDEPVAQVVREAVQCVAHRSPSPTAIGPRTPVSPAARGSSRSSRANDCAAVR